MDASDALRAHSRCKAKLAYRLSHALKDEPYFTELAPHQECPLVRFIRENDGDLELEPELTQVKIAHATWHCANIGLAQKRAAGIEIDVEAEFSPTGNSGSASAALVAAIWRLEKKLHSMAA